MDDGKTGGFLVVFFEEDDGGVVAVCSEFGDFAERKLMAIAVGGAGNIGAVWEEGAEETSFIMEG